MLLSIPLATLSVVQQNGGLIPALITLSAILFILLIAGFAILFLRSGQNQDPRK